MQVGFVVLYVTDAEACSRFWGEHVGMVETKRDEAAGFVIPQVGFADQAFGFQLVPMALMKDNPDNLDLASPSICFQSADLEAPAQGSWRERLPLAGERVATRCDA